MTPNPTHPAVGAGAVKPLEAEPLKAVVAAWEALPGGRNYSQRVVQDWLVDDMKPAIDAARVAIALSDPLSDLVARFSAALLGKLRDAEAKYGYSDAWARDDWRAELVKHLNEHVAKGDPRDVAAYCAFAWHHGWALSPTPPLPEPEAEGEAVAWLDAETDIARAETAANVDRWAKSLPGLVPPSSEAEIADLRAKLELMQAERDAWRKDHADLYALYMERNKERDGLRAKLDRMRQALANRRMASAPQYCQCESPVIRCDMNGCRCTSCGLGEDVLRRARSRSLAGEEKTGASDV